MAKKQCLLIKITPETTLREILAVNIYLLPKLQAIFPYKVLYANAFDSKIKKRASRTLFKTMLANDYLYRS